MGLDNTSVLLDEFQNPTQDNQIQQISNVSPRLEDFEDEDGDHEELDTPVEKNKTWGSKSKYLEFRNKI